MSGNPIALLTDLYKSGDNYMERLRRATERKDIARLVRSLRRWHGDLQAPARAYSPALAAALWKMNPRPKEYARVVGVYPSQAQMLLLRTTATALFRLAPHLADAKPMRKTGPKKKDKKKEIAEARLLRRRDEDLKKLPAAKLVVEKYGKGDSASEKAAIDQIRKKL